MIQGASKMANAVSQWELFIQLQMATYDEGRHFEWTVLANQALLSFFLLQLAVHYVGRHLQGTHLKNIVAFGNFSKSPQTSIVENSSGWVWRQSHS